jgi:DNA-directed RNA polymerase subunit beta
MPATILLKALTYSAQDLLDYFYDKETIYLLGKDDYQKSVDVSLLLGQRATKEIRDPKTDDIIVRKNRKFTRGAVKKITKAEITRISVDEEEIIGAVSAGDVIDDETGEVLLESNETITEEKLAILLEKGVAEFPILFIDGLNVGPYLRDTLLVDKVETEEESLLEIYRRLRPGDPPTIDTARVFFHNLFFNPERYDLSKVGRLKLNYKLVMMMAIWKTPFSVSATSWKLFATYLSLKTVVETLMISITWATDVFVLLASFSKTNSA